MLIEIDTCDWECRTSVLRPCDFITSQATSYVDDLMLTQNEQLIRPGVMISTTQQRECDTLGHQCRCTKNVFAPTICDDLMLMKSDLVL